MFRLRSQYASRIGGGVRGEITEWSDSSRRNFRNTLARIDPARMVDSLDVTLTYPGDWRAYVQDGQQAKRQLRQFAHRWAYAYGWPAWVWKLEFQRRGAPHFHLWVSKPPEVPLEAIRVFVAEAWWEVVHDRPIEDAPKVDQAHLLAGTAVAKVRSTLGFSSYFAGYLGSKKADQEKPPEGFKPGRWWSVPTSLLAEAQYVEKTPEQFTREKRVLRKALVARSKRWKGTQTQTLYTQDAQVLQERLGEWSAST